MNPDLNNANHLRRASVQRNSLDLINKIKKMAEDNNELEKQTSDRIKNNYRRQSSVINF